jgi:hypothetical protein
MKIFARVDDATTNDGKQKSVVQSTKYLIHFLSFFVHLKSAKSQYPYIAGGLNG